jgi:flagellar protein FliO/FliZ
MRRLSVGARSELMVVEMNGQRLLLGVTPSSIQNLYILPSSDDVEAAADEPDRAVSRPLPPEPARTQETTVTRPRAVRRQYDVLEEQAAGIRAIVERK